MINYLFDGTVPAISFLGILAAFVFTCVLMSACSRFLPRDMGRDFAVDGKLSAGKPRGAGLIFVLVFAGAALLFAELSAELIIYLALVVVEMLTGYLDDRADKPWNEYKKGILDLVVSILTAVTYVYFNGSSIELATLGITISIPAAVYCVLATILIWVSINVTNCSDGVDGLSGSLTIITLITIYAVSQMRATDTAFNVVILMFAVSILGYLWYNATPSVLMMGDAGSRAMGFFIAVAAMKSGAPILYIPAALVMILDGGLGLVKVFLLRFLKIRILKNTRTPLHDHVRKQKGWSNTQTVFRFGIIQIVVSMATVACVLL